VERLGLSGGLGRVMNRRGARGGRVVSGVAVARCGSDGGGGPAAPGGGRRVGGGGGGGGGGAGGAAGGGGGGPERRGAGRRAWAGSGPGASCSPSDRALRPSTRDAGPPRPTVGRSTELTVRRPTGERTRRIRTMRPTPQNPRNWQNWQNWQNWPSPPSRQHS